MRVKYAPELRRHQREEAVPIKKPKRKKKIRRADVRDRDKKGRCMQGILAVDSMADDDIPSCGLALDALSRSIKSCFLCGTS